MSRRTNVVRIARFVGLLAVTEAIPRVWSAQEAAVPKPPETRQRLYGKVKSENGTYTFTNSLGIPYPRLIPEMFY